MNSASGMRQIVDHLVALGHRRLVYLNGPRTSWSNKERRRGLRLATQQHGVELIELGPFPAALRGRPSGVDWPWRPKPTAIIAYNDIMALGVLPGCVTEGSRCRRT